MSRRKLGPKQQEHPDLPKSVQQGYGEKISGSHKVKTASHSRQNQKSSHDM
ncbi:small acid-soluble spore protein P [Halobacillus sp. Marseille-Q1614]|uniref:small acid-soluble spore protein P n=1 Tax=Halobacillus sp. Marseille-Q1614 TaxID=2709134 RepID=UPI0015714B78|nr:small acid-soluble spore protein P [Halobacillus sp. Marseille-Q1614]